MNVNIRHRESVTIFDIESSIVDSDSLALKHIINEQLEAIDTGQVKFVLNLEKVRMIDSSGLSILVATFTSIQRKGGRIVLLHGNIRSLIVMAKLVTIFDLYDNEDEAIASL